jgi:hypothetical protein
MQAKVAAPQRRRSEGGPPAFGSEERIRPLHDNPYTKQPPVFRTGGCFV